jgi:beta-mannanase
MAEIEEAEAEMGRSLAIDHHFYAWTDRFPSGLEEWDGAVGRASLITWEPTTASVRAIADGTEDAVIAARADGLRSLDRPVFLRWGHEMNGDWFAWGGPRIGGDDPAGAYVAAYRHIHDVFAERGATNVIWVWSPNAVDAPKVAGNHWSDYYPGDAYVDWVGIDGYNWGTSRSFGRWQRFDDVFGAVYDDYADRKPIMIAETASTEDGGDKASWIAQVRPALADRFPSVAAVVWFDQHKETDWSIGSSPQALAAFRTLAADELLSPRPAFPTNPSS